MILGIPRAGPRAADSIVGVTFFSDEAPAYFGAFSLAFVSMFRITIGSLEWWFEEFPPVHEARSANSAQLLFLFSYVVKALRSSINRCMDKSTACAESTETLRLL